MSSGKLLVVGIWFDNGEESFSGFYSLELSSTEARSVTISDTLLYSEGHAAPPNVSFRAMYARSLCAIVS